MIYSIALLDLNDFESIGRKMPKGTGVDASGNDGATAPKHKMRKRKQRTSAASTQESDRGKKQGISFSNCLWKYEGVKVECSSAHS